MKTDERLRDGFKVYKEEENDKNSIIVVSFFRNEEDAIDNVRATELVIEDARKLIEESSHETCHALIDLAGIGEKMRVLVPESREKYAELMNHPRVGKVAFLGANAFVASLIGVLARMTNKSDRVRWFSDIDEAKSWLKE